MRKIKKNIKRNNKKNSTARIKRRARKIVYIVEDLINDPDVSFDIEMELNEQGYFTEYVDSLEDVPYGANYTYDSRIIKKDNKVIYIVEDLLSLTGTDLFALERELENQGYTVEFVDFETQVPIGANYTYGSAIFQKDKNSINMDVVYVSSNVDPETRALYESGGSFVEEIDPTLEEMPHGVCDWGYGLTTN